MAPLACMLAVHMTQLNKDEIKRLNILITDKKLQIIGRKIINYNFLLADELSLYILD